MPILSISFVHVSSEKLNSCCSGICSKSAVNVVGSLASSNSDHWPRASTMDVNEVSSQPESNLLVSGAISSEDTGAPLFWGGSGSGMICRERRSRSLTLPLRMYSSRKCNLSSARSSIFSSARRDRNLVRISLKRLKSRSHDAEFAQIEKMRCASIWSGDRGWSGKRIPSYILRGSGLSRCFNN